MKKTTCLISLLIYLLVLARPFLPYLEFAINQDFIATVLCINRDKPEVACGGKCHLTKELQKANQEDADQQKPATTTSKTDQFPIALIQTCNTGLHRATDTGLTWNRLWFIIDEYRAEPASPPPKTALI